MLLILSLGKIFLALTILLSFQISLKLWLKNYFLPDMVFSLSVCVHACVYRKQDELLWLDFLGRSPAPFAQSLYMFPQDYTTCWPFHLGCNIWHVDGWLLLFPKHPRGWLHSSEASGITIKSKTVLWSRRIKPIWWYFFNNPLTWWSSGSGKWQLADGSLLHNMTSQYPLLKSSNGTWHVPVEFFDLIYLVLCDNKPRGEIIISS